MKYNLGLTDVLVRLGLMMVVAIVAGIMGWIWLFPVATFFFLEAMLGYCPLYHLLGKNTVEKDYDDCGH